MLIRSAHFLTSSTSLAACPESELPEFAFIGRSNVGKSSLLNLLVGGRNDLAKVSGAPGHTKLINFFTINGAWTLVDLPGYGFAKTHLKERARFADMNEEYLLGRPNLACIFVLIDSRHEPQAIDLDFVQWLADSGQPFALVFTKTDKSKASVVKRQIALFLESIASSCPEPPPVFATSIEDRSGRQELLKFIEEALVQD